MSKAIEPIKEPDDVGVYFVDDGEGGWDIVVLDRNYPSGPIYCELFGEKENWPVGDYYGPIDIDDIKSIRR